MKKVSRTFIYLLGFVALFALGGAYGTSAQSAQNRAGLVVQFGDGTVRSYCIAFEGESIAGMDLLLRSGLEVVIEGYGAMGGQVCKIEAEGCDYPGEVCACKSYGPNGVYWTYHHLRAGVWKTSALGASSYRVRSGEVDGWAWSSGKGPIVKTFEQICGVAQPLPTSTPNPPISTSTPRPQPTSTTRPPSATPGQRPQPTQTHKPPAATPPLPKPSNTARMAATGIPTATRRPPTSTSIPARPQPTNTRQPQVVRPSATKTAIRQATATRRAAGTSITVPTATPSRTATVVATPSEQRTSATPTSVPVQPTFTRTVIPPAETIAPTSIVAEKPVPPRTKTPVALPTTSKLLPAPGAQPPSADTARTISIAIGATIVAGLLVWGGVKLASRRIVTGKRRGGPRVG